MPVEQDDAVAVAVGAPVQAQVGDRLFAQQWDEADGAPELGGPGAQAGEVRAGHGALSTEVGTAAGRGPARKARVRSSR